MSAPLNATETCSCGGPKPRQKQWCDGCYAHLNEHDRFQFLHAMSMMDAQVQACQRAIDKSRRFDTPEMPSDHELETLPPMAYQSRRLETPAIEEELSNKERGALLDGVADTIYRNARKGLQS